jgi:hypothetical protein
LGRKGLTTLAGILENLQTPQCSSIPSFLLWYVTCEVDTQIGGVLAWPGLDFSFVFSFFLFFLFELPLPLFSGWLATSPKLELLLPSSWVRLTPVPPSSSFLTSCWLLFSFSPENQRILSSFLLLSRLGLFRSVVSRLRVLLTGGNWQVSFSSFLFLFFVFQSSKQKVATLSLSFVLFCFFSLLFCSSPQFRNKKTKKQKKHTISHCEKMAVTPRGFLLTFVLLCLGPFVSFSYSAFETKDATNPFTLISEELRYQKKRQVLCFFFYFYFFFLSSLCFSK